MARKGFSSEKAQIANLQQQVDSLRAQNNMLNAKIKSLGGKRKSPLLSKNESNNDIFSHFPILNALFQNAVDNSDRDPRGYRYTPEIYNFCMQFNSIGEHYYDLLHKYLGFPSKRSMKKFRMGFFSENTLSQEIFDGKIENVQRLFNIHLGSTKHIPISLAIDAASVTPSLRVWEEGMIDGLIGLDKVSKEEAEKLINDDKSFDSFLVEHRSHLISAEFVILALPHDPQFKPFPLQIIDAKNGKANQAIISTVEQTILTLQQMEIKVYSINSDGDRSYLHFSDSVYKIFEESVLVN